MKIPVIPLAVAAILVVVVLVLFNSMSSGKKVFGPARLERLVDFEGIETEVAIAPDANRLAAVSSGDLWISNVRDGSRQKLAETVDSECFPAFAPDGKRLTYTRGNDTFEIDTDMPSAPQLFKENATSLSWSSTGRLAFVRDRALWITDAAGGHERSLIEADANTDVSVRSPRFSPDSTQVAFVKTNRGLQGEVWLVDATSGAARSLVADRWAENPLDVGWIENGKKLVYLTNRSGAVALWYVDLDANTIAPLTTTLDERPLDRIGMAVSQDRIIVPRHDVVSSLALSDGTTITPAKDLQFEPSVSHDATLVAFTHQHDTKLEIWTAGIHGEDPKFRTLGSQPRFAPNAFELVYTYTDPLGQVDVRKIDLRDGSSAAVTDAAEIDFEPDWSPDGRTIAFASNQGGGPMTLWTIPAVGGKRRTLGIEGYFPKFSPDGHFLLFWRDQSLWTSTTEGQGAKRIRGSILNPLPGAWLRGMPKTYLDHEVSGGKLIWPEVDVLPDGRTVIAPIEIRETALWTVNLTYVEQ